MPAQIWFRVTINDGLELLSRHNKKAAEAAYVLQFFCRYSLFISLIVGKAPELVQFIHGSSEPRQVFFR